MTRDIKTVSTESRISFTWLQFSFVRTCAKAQSISPLGPEMKPSSEVSTLKMTLRISRSLLLKLLYFFRIIRPTSVNVFMDLLSLGWMGNRNGGSKQIGIFFSSNHFDIPRIVLGILK